MNPATSINGDKISDETTEQWYYESILNSPILTSPATIIQIDMMYGVATLPQFTVAILYLSSVV